MVVGCPHRQVTLPVTLIVVNYVRSHNALKPKTLFEVNTKMKESGLRAYEYTLPA